MITTWPLPRAPLPQARRPLPCLPAAARAAVRRQHAVPSRFFLAVSIATQTMELFERLSAPGWKAAFPEYLFKRRYRVSTSRFGMGQVMDSNQTPRGLHRVARKVGAGHPVGTVFKSRRPIGLTWEGMADAGIVHRILWLEGLEPGLNRGGRVDTFQRYVYIHGYGDELTLGKPQSRGCVHLAAVDLLPLFDRLPTGTLVWIAA